MKSSVPNVPNVPLSTNVTLPVRLRRAIHLNDLVLVKRIAKKRPDRLQNPDFADNGNTSLHLAAQLGFLEIAQFLVDAGHEDDSISCNANGETPLHLAVETSVPIAILFASRFPRCISWKNKQGADAVMLSARTASSFPANPTSPPAQQSPPQFRSTAPSPQLLVSTLIQYSPLPASVLLSAADHDGNTALHYASAYGQLKAIRALLAAGANPGARNAYSWTPVAYSSTVQAEVYFRGLIGAGGENGLGGGAVKREAEGGGGGGLSRGGVGGAGLRIVRTREELGSGMDMRFGDGRRRAGSAD
ncbi:MAG: hypothetical protein LQ341_000443 [Variospora aurantia]|nr:MAG: hypothetical protein LQ341_000443 [Variospora aurantia]